VTKWNLSAAVLAGLASAAICAGCGRDDADSASSRSDAPSGSEPSARPTDPTPPEGLRFVDTAADAGIEFRQDSGFTADLHLYETMGGGAAWLDYDRDGDSDLYVTSGVPRDAAGRLEQVGRNRLYRNDGKARFVDDTDAAGVRGRGYGLGAIAGDIDNDGDPDLYVICFGPNLLYRNRGDGSFEELRDAGTEGKEPFSGGAAFADFDGDGRVDLFLATYLYYDEDNPPPCFEPALDGSGHLRIYCGPGSYDGAPDQLFRNLGDGRFGDITREAGIGLGSDARGKSLGVLAGDVDADADVDVLVACDTTANLLYRNRGNGTFDEVGLECGFAASDTGRYEGGMGLALFDANGDGDADILVTNFGEERNRLHLAAHLETGGLSFVDGTARTGIGRGSIPNTSWGIGVFDAGCDARLDVIIANGHIYHNAEKWLARRTYEQRNLFYTATGDGRFRACRDEVGAALEPFGAFRGIVQADHDLDGEIDLLVMRLDDRPLLLRGIGPRGHWLAVELVGDGPGGRDAVGARVEVRTATAPQYRWRTAGGGYLSEDEPRLHFGLGDDDRVERLRVRWPGGGTSVRENLPVDRVIVVRRKSA